MNWYVIFVQTGHEDDICVCINHVMSERNMTPSYSLLVPKRKLHERRHGVYREVVRNMFPGYILVNTEDINGFYMSVREVPRIIRFLGNNNIFLPAANEEINRILNISDRNGLIDISKGRLIHDKVIITEGPLFGSENIVKNIDKRKGRAKVELSISGNLCRVDLGINIEK